MARCDRDYWGQERGPEVPLPVPPTDPSRIEPDRPRRGAISAADYHRLIGDATRRNTTVDVLWLEEQAREGGAR